MFFTNDLGAKSWNYFSPIFVGQIPQNILHPYFVDQIHDFLTWVAGSNWTSATGSVQWAALKVLAVIWWSGSGALLNCMKLTDLTWIRRWKSMMTCQETAQVFSLYSIVTPNASNLGPSLFRLSMLPWWAAPSAANNLFVMKLWKSWNLDVHCQTCKTWVCAFWVGRLWIRQS